METKSIRLTESQESLLSLSAEQFEALVEAREDLKAQKQFWREQVTEIDNLDVEDVESQARAILVERVGSQTRVKVHNAVGAIALPGLTLIVDPKIPLAHFSHIASMAVGYEPRSSRATSSLNQGTSFIELVSSWFIEEAERLLRFGLQYEYRSERTENSFARGRLMIVESVKGWQRGKTTVVSDIEEFDEDNAFNRVIKAAAQAVLNSPVMNKHVRARAMRIAAIMSHVGSLQNQDLLLPGLSVPRESHITFRYALQVLRGIGRSLNVGLEASKSFLLPTPLVMESGIREILKTELFPVEVRKIGKRLEGSFVTVNPDIAVSAPPFTGDVKYKMASRTWNRSDLAQAVFFAAAFRSSVGLVINFAVTAETQPPNVKVGDIEILAASWFVGDEWSPGAAQDSFVEQVKSVLAVHQNLNSGVIGSSARLFQQRLT